MGPAPTTSLLQANAPGKVLLIGEHAVVHGTPAIACALDVGIELKHADDNAPLRIALRAGQTSTTRPPENSGSNDAQHNTTTSVTLDQDHPIALATRAILTELGQHSTPTGLVTATSRLPTGAGLGSSAALCVALTRLFARIANITLDDEQTLHIALAGECVFHGNASGLDPAASINGGLIAFQRGNPPTVTPLDAGCPLHFVVAQVEDGANTRQMVDAVSARIQRAGRAGNHLLDAIADLGHNAQDAITAGNPQHLGELLDINHGILVSLGASTPTLDASCHAARNAGAFGAKLTGAGGGGCIIALAPDDRLANVADALRPQATFLRTLSLPAIQDHP